MGGIPLRKYSRLHSKEVWNAMQHEKMECVLFVSCLTQVGFHPRLGQMVGGRKRKLPGIQGNVLERLGELGKELCGCKIW